MENIKDWCISRQLWWGHRIPAYYCEDCGEAIVTDETIKKWVCRGEFEGTKIGRKWFFDREYVRGKIQKNAS